MPRRRTVPFDDRPTLRDDYRAAPVAPSTPRLRERYDRDVVRPSPAPTVRTSPRGADRERATPQPRSSPRLVARPDAPPRARVTPRYQPPGQTTLHPRASRSAELVRDARDGRHRAPWTFGRSSRVFHGRGPWGVNAAGRRIFGFWRGRWCSPHAFSWCYVPSWCRWGFLSWSAWGCSLWPIYYDYCAFGWRSTIGYWSTYTPYYAARHYAWYWPSTVYAPVTVYAAGYDPGYYDDPDVDVTIRIEDGREAAVESPGGAVRIDRAPPSKEMLAARHVTLADAYFREGRYQDAVDAYLRALTYLPDDASIHMALADALFALGDYHYAAFMIGKAFELDPSLASVVIDKHKFYDDPAKFDAQLETLRRYTEEKPYDAAAMLVFAVNLRFAGDAAGAERALTRVLEVDKDNAAAELLREALRAEKAAAEKPAEKPAETPVEKK